MDGNAAFDKAFVAEQIAMQRRVGFDAVHRQFVHGDAHFCHCQFARFAVYADFADEAVVVRWDFVALVNVAVHAHAQAAGQVTAFNQAGAGNEGVRVFRVDAAFKRMAFQHDVFLTVLQRQSCGHAKLFLHDVHAGDQLGNRVLHLHARVHFDEEELAVFIQELERACAAVADTFAGIGA